MVPTFIVSFLVEPCDRGDDSHGLCFSPCRRGAKGIAPYFRRSSSPPGLEIKTIVDTAGRKRPTPIRTNPLYYRGRWWRYIIFPLDDQLTATIEWFHRGGVMGWGGVARRSVPCPFISPVRPRLTAPPPKIICGMIGCSGHGIRVSCEK